MRHTEVVEERKEGQSEREGELKRAVEAQWVRGELWGAAQTFRTLIKVVAIHKSQIAATTANGCGMQHYSGCSWNPPFESRL